MTKTVSYGCEACTVQVDEGLYELPANNTSRGGDPDLERAELLHFITEQIDAHPRSQQTRIGPSEMGTECTRRIGYKLLDVEPANPSTGAWLPTIGTAVHTWLEAALTAVNDRGHERFYLEQKVTVGQVGGQDITGSCDVYDRVTATVIDWKIVGPTKLRDYKRNGPGEQYRAQAHLYGRGYVNAGLPVDTVAVMFLPRNGQLADAYYWHEPYDEQIALAALNKVNGVAALTAAVGRSALSALPVADSHCNHCPWFRPGSTDIATACPGDPGGATARAATPPATLADALT